MWSGLSYLGEWEYIITCWEWSQTSITPSIISDSLDLIYRPCKMFPAGARLATNKRRRQQGSIPSEKLAKFAKLLTCSPARGAGRAGQGSLQSLFWFPGRNKARINVLWRARTSTGPLVPSTACQSTLSWLSPASSLQAAVQLLSRLSGAGGGGPADQGVAVQLLICHSPWVPARTPHCVR